MILDLLKEFVLELLRALVLEELCQRVKNHLNTRRHRRRTKRWQSLLRRIQLRHRDRLLHRLTTEAGANL